MAENVVSAETRRAFGNRPAGVAAVRARLFGIGTAEATFARRGFPATAPDRQQRLEQIGGCFVAGYNAAVRAGDPNAVASDLNEHRGEMAGFAHEGAAMGFALLDLLSPVPSRRFARFLAGAGAPHVYMAHVGAGWALARTSPFLAWRLGLLDPLTRWLMFDGFGFHCGFFHHRSAILGRRVPWYLHGHQRAVFDQGLGRSFWFVFGARPDAIVGAIETFAPARRADLWSGAGLAAAYAGGVDAAELGAMLAASGVYQPHLAQGAAFAAQARQRAGNPAPHTELACRAFLGMSATEAASLTDQALPNVAPRDRGNAYQAWRAEIRRLAVATGEARS